MADFTTDSMRYRAVEHVHWMYTHPDAFAATRVVPDDRTPLMRYIAKRMRRVVTPYVPCTDLLDPGSEWWCYGQASVRADRDRGDPDDHP